MLSESLGGVQTDVTPVDKYEPDNRIWYGLIVLLFVAIITFNWMFAIVRVSGRSMDNTLKDGQFVLVNKHREIH